MSRSAFDIFKIGIGPSSSHTMGPMIAAKRFLEEVRLESREHSARTKPVRLAVRLHGSLAYTGSGHGTDRAIVLGLNGHAPDSIDPDGIEDIVAQTATTHVVAPPGHPSYSFNPATDLVFDRKTPLRGHPNGMTFEAIDDEGCVALRRHYFSIGGGAVLRDDELNSRRTSYPQQNFPYAFRTAGEMLEMAEGSGLSIAKMQMANEQELRSEREIICGLDEIWQTMRSCIGRGLSKEGTLPGGLGVKRRAKVLHAQLLAERESNSLNGFAANEWLSLFAMAVNEENAAGGRVVTAPTNGAAGVLPAVLAFANEFMAGVRPSGIHTFLLTASAVGHIIKTNASVSGAEVGCQGEVGSAASMAAAGLCAIMGGTPKQVENAAEIAIEHHLGMTCDPIGGLVQVPCIERNAMGAVKAVTAASLAMRGDGAHLVSLDVVIATLRQTGLDMHEKYKETSTGGLAANYVAC